MSTSERGHNKSSLAFGMSILGQAADRAAAEIVANDNMTDNLALSRIVYASTTPDLLAATTLNITGLHYEALRITVADFSNDVEQRARILSPETIQQENARNHILAYNGSEQQSSDVDSMVRIAIATRQMARQVAKVVLLPSQIDSGQLHVSTRDRSLFVTLGDLGHLPLTDQRLSSAFNHMLRTWVAARYLLFRPLLRDHPKSTDLAMYRFKYIHDLLGA